MSASQANATGPNGLTLALASNNPFRNRTASPPGAALSPPPLSPFDDPPPRPTSTNPFLDPAPGNNFIRRPSTSSDMLSSSPPKKPASPTAEDIFDALTLDDGKAKKPTSRPPGPPGARPPVNRPPGAPGAPRRENMPPKPRGPPPGHRPTRSQEEAMKARRAQSGGEKLISIESPQKRPTRRPRRNSESSVMDIETEEERKKRKEKERERRQQKKPNKRIDVIDQLDATSVYGSGLFHHDGPFDACNPHRNRKGSRRAPVQAFAKDSLNMAVGGSGPLNKRPNHATLMGNHDEEAFKDYAKGANENGAYKPGSSKRAEQTLWDPKGRDEVVHGDESMGLGSSTFLEGAPAARSAIARRQAEAAQQTSEQGLARKKSLAQRIRNINRAPQVPGRAYGDGATPRTADISAGSNGNGNGEYNPFFNEFDKSGEEQISVVRRTDSNPITPLSPPTNGSHLERRATTDSTGPTAVSPDGSKQQSNGGFLSRVKSLKGGLRQRPAATSVGEESAPGTAV